MRAALLLSLLLACNGGGDDDTGPAVEPGPFTATQGDPEADCAPSTTLKPRDADDGGTWVAGRLAPPGYPARVEEVTVRFDNRVPCTISVPALVRVFVAGEEPPADPGFIAAGEAEAGEGGGQIFTVTLGAPAELAEGDYVYVAAQYAVDDATGNTRCLTLCQDADRSDEAWWGNAAESPFTWEPISSGDVVGQVAISMSGEVLAP